MPMGPPFDADDGVLTAPAARGRGILVYWQDHVSTHELPARGSLTVGRSRECDIAIDHPSVSRKHVAIHVDAVVTVEDLGSSNGTVLNGKRLKAGEPQRLPAGAVVEVGLATLVIRSSEGG